MTKLFVCLLMLLSCNAAKKSDVLTPVSSETSTTIGADSIVPAQFDAKGDLIKVIKSEGDWKKELNAAEFNVLREKGTERAFTGDLWNNKLNGTYICAACGLPLFSSETKFDSGTGWPSYFAPLDKRFVLEESDTKFGMERTEILCARCGGHQGHVFNDGPQPTGLRYCINAVSMNFVPK